MYMVSAGQYSSLSVDQDQMAIEPPNHSIEHVNMITIAIMQKEGLESSMI